MTTKNSRLPLAAEREITTNRAAFVDFLTTVYGVQPPVLSPRSGPDWHGFDWHGFDWAGTPAMADALRDFMGWGNPPPRTLIEAIPRSPAPALILRLGDARRVWSYDDLRTTSTLLAPVLHRPFDPLRTAARHLLDDDARPDDRILLRETNARHLAGLLLSGAALVLHNAPDARGIADLALEESVTLIHGEPDQRVIEPETLRKLGTVRGILHDGWGIRHIDPATGETAPA